MFRCLPLLDGLPKSEAFRIFAGLAEPCRGKSVAGCHKCAERLRCCRGLSEFCINPAESPCQTCQKQKP